MSRLRPARCMTREEEAYFFRLSKYAGRVRIASDRAPTSSSRSPASNEMVNNFIEPGPGGPLRVPHELSPGAFPWTLTRVMWSMSGSMRCSTISRRSALKTTSMTTSRKFWPADVHFVGKEIVRFHSIIWPAMLMSLGSAASQEGLRPWLARHGRRQNVQIQGQRRRPRMCLPRCSA